MNLEIFIIDKITDNIVITNINIKHGTPFPLWEYKEFKSDNTVNQRKNLNEKPINVLNFNFLGCLCPSYLEAFMPQVEG